MAPEKGSAPALSIKIPLKEGGRNASDIEKDIKTEFKSLGYKWFTDYYLDRKQNHILLSVYNRDLEKHVPQTIIGDLI